MLVSCCLIANTPMTIAYTAFLQLGVYPYLISTDVTISMQIQMTTPSGDELKAARVKSGLSQVEAAILMGYPVQSGSRGGQQSRTWQALESATDPRNMPGPTFAMFQLLTDSHPTYALTKKDTCAELDVDGIS